MVEYDVLMHGRITMCGCIYFVFVFSLIILISVRSDGVTEFSTLQNISHLPDRAEYWNSGPPGFNDSSETPVVVHVKLHFRRVEKIDYSGETLLQLDCHSTWYDIRLNDSENQHANNMFKTNFSELWKPNIVFSNETDKDDQSNVINPKTSIRPYRNGTVLLSRRLTLVAHCRLELQLYPFDKTICGVQLIATSDTVKHVRLQWSDHEPVLFSEHFPNIPTFVLEEYQYSEEAFKTSTGEYPIISLQLRLCRKFRFYFLRYYLPVLLTLLISWTPFWLARVLILRIYIGMSTVIFLGWSYISQPNELRISYLTALDAWRGINFVFILLAAYESLFVTYMIKTNTNMIKRTHPDDNERFKMIPCKDCPHKKKYLEVDNVEADVDLEIMKLKANFKICFINVAKEVEIIDTVAKVFFPSAYLIFIFFYWLKCNNNILSYL